MSSENKAQFWLKLLLFIPPPHTVPKVWFKVHPCHKDTHLAPWGGHSTRAWCPCVLALHPCSRQHCLSPPSTALTNPLAAVHPTPVCQRQSLLQHRGESALGDISHCGTTHGEIRVRSWHSAVGCKQHSSTRLTAQVPPSHLLYIQPLAPGWTSLRQPRDHSNESQLTEDSPVPQRVSARRCGYAICGGSPHNSTALEAALGALPRVPT